MLRPVSVVLGHTFVAPPFRAASFRCSGDFTSPFCLCGDSLFEIN